MLHFFSEHMRWLKKQYPRKSKNTKWLQDQHHRTFTYWLDEKVCCCPSSFK